MSLREHGIMIPMNDKELKGKGSLKVGNVFGLPFFLRDFGHVKRFWHGKSADVKDI